MAGSRLAGLIAAILIATTGWAATPSPSLIVTPPQPKWSELTVQQRTVLAPLSDDWDSFEYHQQKKWLGIVSLFPAMTPKEQQRIQIRMQEWGKLTDDERALARENYISAKQLSIEKKRELKKKWEEYSSLPADEKARLKERAMQYVNKSLGTIPLPAPTTPRQGNDTAPVAGPAADPMTMDIPAIPEPPLPTEVTEPNVP